MKKRISLLFFAAILFTCTAVSASNCVIPIKDTIPTDTTLSSRIDEEAVYPGGAKAWLKFLTKTMKGDVPANNGAPFGTYKTITRFIVDVDGTLSNFEKMTNIGYGMEDEAIRVIALSGKWLPAKLNGKPVRAYRIQPLTFQFLSK